MFQKIKEFLFGKHSQIERFGLSFTILVLCFVIVLTAGFKGVGADTAHIMDTQAVFNKTFTTSLSQQPGKVHGVFSNDDYTRAFVLFSFDNIALASTDATNYQAFLTGADVSGNDPNIEVEPTASFYVFGNTGYMGVYLTNMQGFPKQIYHLTLRSNSPLVKKDLSNTHKNNQPDASFLKHDQFNIFFNPGAKDTEKIAVLNNPNPPTATELFRDVVAKKEELRIKEGFQTYLKEMQDAYNAAKEYQNRVLNINKVNLPGIPEQIAGDEILQTEDGRLYLKTTRVIPGAVNYNWLDKTLAEGYIEEAKYNYFGQNATTVTNDQFLLQQEQDASRNPGSIKIRTDEWRLQDGTLIEDLNTGTQRNERYTQLNNDNQALIGAWNDFYNAKRRFQTVELVKLLDLENSLNTIEQTYTVNTSDDFIQVY